jgi:hypothetical protein
MGGLVTGFGTHGAPCWITQLSREDVRLTVAKPAVLSVKRLWRGRTVVVHLSHRTGETWRIIPLRGAIIGARGNTFNARITAPTPNVIEGLLRALLVQGRAKKLSEPVDEADETVATKPLPASNAAAEQTPSPRRTTVDSSALAQAWRAVVENHAAKWVGNFLDRTEELLFAHISQEKDPLMQRQFDGCYLSLLMARQTLVTEIPKQLAAAVDDLLAPAQGQLPELQDRASARSLDLTSTINLDEALAYTEAIDFLERTTAPQKIIHIEERLSQLLNERIDERNNPLRVDRVCALAMSIVFQHWDAGTSVRQVVNDALRDSGSALSELYDALSAAVDTAC